MERGMEVQDVQFPSTVPELGARLADMKMENLGDTSISLKFELKQTIEKTKYAPVHISVK